MSNAVLVWNTAHINGIVSRLRDAGNLVQTRTLPASHPPFAHITPNGIYFHSPRNRPAVLPSTALSPLRDIAGIL
jgi:hypothetical protein